MVAIIFLILYIFGFVSQIIQASTWKTRSEENYFTFSYLEDWMPKWTREKDRYTFNALYYGQEGSEDGQVESNNVEISEIQCRIVILTAGDEDFNTLVELERNRIGYSRRQKYCYLHFSCKRSKR